MVGLWGREDALEEEMATHSSILARRVPWTGKPSGLHGVTKNQDMTEGHHHDEYFRNTRFTCRQTASPPLRLHTRLPQAFAARLRPELF